MKTHPITLLLFALFLGAAIPSSAQGANPSQQPAQGSGGDQRGGRGGWGGGMMGRGVVGTVTEVAADHYTIKTENGEIYTIHYSVNTRLMKQPAQRQRGQAQDQGGERTPPQAIKATDIKVGDAIAASGEVDANAKSVGAVVVFQIDPERAKQMREMEANYGKTWLMGKVTAINDLKITLQGGPDNLAHTFTADESTTFRKRRDPITLADIQVGDMVRVEGAAKEGAFLATTVTDMGIPSQGPHGPRSNEAPPPQ
jgi:preprotein translocase subunit YajC